MRLLAVVVLLFLLPAPLAAAQTAAPAEPTLTREEVRALQKRIGQRQDGVLGPKTRAALARAERRRGLPVDGLPDARLLTALGLAPRTTVASGDPVAAALSVLGAPYGSGAAGPGAFDCSGLVQWAFARAGVRLPRSSFDQHRAGRPVARSAIRRGDLVFFSTAGAGPSDVAIATSPTTVVSATTNGVREHATFDAYWGRHFVGARRVG